MSTASGTSPGSWPTSATSPRAAWLVATTAAARPYCACHADPPRLHGPYWLFTAKLNGKTVNKRLSEREARLYQQWIANDRHARCPLGDSPFTSNRRVFSRPPG
jgi:hypothetical protein